MKVLNVAEKNDAAKRIANLLGGGNVQTRNGFSVYNKLYHFKSNFRNQLCDMVMTSVSGHLLNFEFDQQYRKWYSCDPVELFDAPVQKMCTDNMKEIKRTLEHQAPHYQILIIWTDCDREGENIGYEVISVCQSVNPRLQIYRAKFSEITKQAIDTAMRNLIQPDKRVSDAVDVRQELDLRIGAAFTRFQTLRLTKKFPAALSDRLISYGSCQFPTLGFVVERYKSILDFIREDFWKIDVSHKVDDLVVNFSWARVRLFERLAVQSIYEACLDNPLARVIKAQSKPKSKWRPVALDTIEFEKLASRKLKIGAKEAMQIAEQLYTSGYISYPRTETNIFPPSLNLAELIEQQRGSNQWGGFATRLLHSGGPSPRNGKKSDQAHPPIHPTKFDALQHLSDKHRKVYELICRHFLACCSKDAVGKETVVEIEIAGEKFIASGLIVIEKNYLEVYIYDKWSDKEIPEFREQQTFRPTKIEMSEGSTAPPNLLTEADLIALMEKHGIGTDATHAEHIETIKQRQYVGLQGVHFIPGKLGMGLVEGYDSMGFAMSKPHLRAELESDLQKICEGTKQPDIVLREQVQNYKRVFIQATDQVARLDEAIARLLTDTPSAGGSTGGAGGNGGGGGGGNDGGGGGGYDGGGGGGSNTTRGGNYGGGVASTGRGGNYGGGAANTGTGRGGNYGGGAANTGTGRGGNYGGGAANTGTGRGGNYGGGAANTGTGRGGNYGGGGASTSRGGNYGGGGAGTVRGGNYGRSDADTGRGGNYGGGSAGDSVGYGGNYGGGGVGGSTDSGENNGDGVPMCSCNKQAIQYTVRKDGPNKGRKFFGCAVPYAAQEHRCGFFQWDDAGIGNSNTNTGRNREDSTPYTGIGNSRKGGNRGGGAKRARRCGLCHQEGHTRRNCPVAGGDDDDDEAD